MKKLAMVLAFLLFTNSMEGGETGLTIYNQNFGVVRDLIPMNLKEGVNPVTSTNITAHLEPSSVILRDPKGKTVFRILEQNYRADPVSQQLLLSHYEGKTVDFLIQAGERSEVVQGKIIRSGYVPHQAGMRRYGQQYTYTQMAHVSGGSGQPIIEMDGKLRFGLPGIPLFPALADDAILKPTIHWLIESSQDREVAAEISYLTGGMSWVADYNAVAAGEGDVLDLIGWVTMDNQSGKTFENAKIKLVAGDVSKIQPQQAMDYMFAAGESRSMMGPAVSEKAFDEYHMYTLERPTTLHDRETKQVEFIRASGVQAKRIYVYDGAKINLRQYQGWDMETIRQQREYGTQSNPKVWVMREFKNSSANHLGIPLPKGLVRFYRRDDDGQLEFVGENIIDHTPRNETVRVYTGDAFDLVGERRRTDYQINHQEDWLDESFEIKLRNHKSESVEIRVVEHLYRWINWDIQTPSSPFVKTDSQTMEFRTQLEPDEEKIITYKVHYTW